MSLPRAPAFPVLETVNTGTILSDPVQGALIPVFPPAVNDERTFDLVFPRLHGHQANEIRRLYQAKRTIAYWQFNRKYIDRGADNLVWARFGEPVRIEWFAPDQYRVRILLHQRVDPLV